MTKLLVSNCFIFLLAISISSLALPSMVPNFTLIINGLLVVAIIFNLQNYNKIKSPISFNKLLLPIIALLLLSIWILIRSWGNNGIFSDLNLLCLHVLFIIFILVTQKFIYSYIKSYVYFVFIMAICSIIGYSLFVFNLIDPLQHFVSMYDLTHCSFTRDKFIDNSYIMPYGLGFILMADGQLELLGYDFYRVSGWAHEPTSGAYFTVPALMLVLHDKVLVRGRVVIGITISIFLLLLMSVGSFLALLIIYIPLTISWFYTRIKGYNSLVYLFFLMLSVVLFGSMIFTSILDSTLVSSKFDMDSQTMNVALRELFWFVPNIYKTDLYYFTHLFLWAIIVLFFIAAVVNLNSIYSLILLYLIVHSMKGSEETVFYLVFTFFWFYMVSLLEHNKLIKESSHEGL